jgi:hypothetical protein
MWSGKVSDLSCVVIKIDVWDSTMEIDRAEKLLGIWEELVVQ